MTARVRPAMFIGSSVEGLPTAKAVQILLDRSCEAEVWSQGIFGLSEGTLESLVLAVDRFDFAVLVLTPDDLTVSRGTDRQVARDNVVFELGLFTGALGRDRTFMLFDRTRPPALPTDLAGITAATFEPHASGNLVPALGAACTRIEGVVGRLGLRDTLRIQRLSDAADSVQHVGSQMEALVRLLARSRKVELDVIAGQFAQMIEPAKLAQMRKDLEELEATLKDG